MFTKRIIPCLDVNDGRVVKGVNFVNLMDAGDPVEIAAAYDEAGADELGLSGYHSFLRCTEIRWLIWSEGWRRRCLSLLRWAAGSEPWMISGLFSGRSGQGVREFSCHDESGSDQ